MGRFQRRPAGRVTIAQEGWVVRARAIGVFDLTTADTFEDELAAALRLAGHRPLLVDLSEVTFMNVAGVRVLLAAVRAAKRGDRALRVSDPSPAVVRLFETLGAERLKDLVTEVDSEPRTS